MTSWRAGARLAVCCSVVAAAGALCTGCGNSAAGGCGTCDTNAICDTSAKPAACLCVAGYTGNGKTCAPVTCPAFTVANGAVTPTGEATFQTVASIGCESGYTLNGDATRTCQADGTWSGLAPTCEPVIDGCDAKPCVHGPCTTTGTTGGYSCGPCEAGYAGANCDQPVFCGGLTDPQNGSVTPTSTSFGGTASYGCHAGYALNGDATRTCQADGTWSGTAPTCEPNSCTPDLVAPADGTVSLTSGVTGEVATYGCDSGYSLSGNTTRLCQPDGTWSGTDPTCARSQDACDPNPCLHGGACTLSGASGFSCDCSGGWTGATCDQAVSCSGATAPAHGAVSATSVSFGAAITYSCDQGYTLAGPATRQCQADGSFAGAAPTCAANPCAPDLGAPANGSVSMTHGVTGDTATYDCDAGFALAGSATRLCQTDGTWSGAAPTCTLVTTGCSPNPCQNGGTCTPAGTGSFTCACAAGWTGTTCGTLLVCSGATAPLHGAVSAASASFGASVTYSCDPGYTLAGAATRQCQADATFAGTAPTCAANFCAPDLTAPANGSVSTTHGATGDVATFGCDFGYALAGSATRLCQTDGTWSGASPVCTLVTTGCSPSPCQNGAPCTAVGASGFSCACTTGWTGSICDQPVTCGGATAPSHGTVSAASATYAASITYACDAGYGLSGVATRQCQADATFAGTAPTCVANACAPALTAPANGHVTATTGVTGDVVTFSCDNGYSLTGNATRTCQTNGTWSGSAPTCTLVTTGCTPNPCVHSASCTPIGATGYSCGTCNAGWTGANCDVPITCSGAVAPAHGSVSAASATFGQSVGYSCNTGWTLSGAASRTCQSDGTFSGSAPVCNPVACGAPPAVAHAPAPAVSGGAGGGATTTYGATAAYSCSAGYQKAGADATCGADGTWSAAPTCAVIDCGAPPFVINAGAPAVSGGVGGAGTTTFGATAAYSCDPGYAKAGADPTCGGGGAWGAAPTCNVIDCGAPPAVGNAGAPSVSGGIGGGATTTYGATAAYSCNAGYNKAGGNPTCGGGGWTAAPTCTPADCGAPPAVAHAGAPAVSGGAGGGSSTTFGATAAYTCNAHYNKNGANPACGASGSWGAAPTCDPVNCGTPPIVANAGAPSVSGGLGGGATTTFGATAAYSCDPGYAKAGADAACGAGGAWGTPPTCNVINCGAPPAVVNAGAPSVSGGLGGGATTTFGATAAYSCNAGYTKAGGNPTCGGGGWTAAPTCDPVNCGAAPALVNAGAPVVSGGAGGGSTTTLGATAAYTCNANYAKNGADPTCLAGGSWSGAPTCDPVNCGTPPAVANAGAPTVSGGLGGGSTTTVGATAAYACNAGYTKNGGDPTCGAGGSWGAAPTCAPIDCGAPPAVANAGAPVVSGGAGGGSTTTFGATAAYTCNTNFTKSGSDPVCAVTGLWGAAPTCVASVCGTFTDVVYRLTGTFAITNTLLGMGNQSFPGQSANATTPPFVGAGNSTQFSRPPPSGGTTFTNGLARLRYTNDASGNPQAGTVRLVEWYVPLEFHQTAGATLNVNTDQSVGLLLNPASLSNCEGSGATVCTNHAPALQRACTANAQGTLSGTTLSWASCTPNPPMANGWTYANARAAAGAGCAANYNSWGTVACVSGCGNVPDNGKGDSYQTWNQQLKSFTFSGTNIKTATFTMPAMQVPNDSGTGITGATTSLTITSTTVVGSQCGSTPGTDLVCNIQ